MSEKAEGKRCQKCKCWMNIEEFSPDKHSFDGYRSVCKECALDPNHPSQRVGRQKGWRK